MLTGLTVDRAVRSLFPPRYPFATNVRVGGTARSAAWQPRPLRLTGHRSTPTTKRAEWARQLSVGLLAADGEAMPDVLAINAASLALASSDVPWNGPVAAVRVAHVRERGWLVNPRFADLEQADVQMLYARSASGVRLIDADGRRITPSLLGEGVRVGDEAVRTVPGSRTLCSSVTHRSLTDRSASPSSGSARAGAGAGHSRPAATSPGALWVCQIQAHAGTF